MLYAYNKKLRQLEPVLLICFVNKYVDVMPERNLEGGDQETWQFSDIDLFIKCDRVLLPASPTDKLQKLRL